MGRPTSLPETARFDPEPGAWVLSRYEDVAAALRDPRFAAASARATGAAAPDDEMVHARLHETARSALAPERLAGWKSQIEPLARDMLAPLATGAPFELVREFAEPWSLAVAARVVGVDSGAEQLAGFAREVFTAADQPYDAVCQARAQQAAAELARRLPPAFGPLGLQTFIALSQSLPCFLAGAWLALVEHPAQMDLVGAEPDLMPKAIEELLRYAGPARAQLRRAVARVNIGGVSIECGERVMLMLAAANRDPEQFPDPDRLDIRRPAAGHLAFGGGMHACAGAPLVRMAASAATGAFVARFSTARIHRVEWRDSFVIQAPLSLWISAPDEPPESADRPPKCC